MILYSVGGLSAEVRETMPVAHNMGLGSGSDFTLHSRSHLGSDHQGLEFFHLVYPLAQRAVGACRLCLEIEDSEAGCTVGKGHCQ